MKILIIDQGLLHPDFIDFLKRQHLQADYIKVTIGENCQIASCTFISDTDFHPINPSTRERESLGYKIDHTEVNKKPVIIGNNVWIGWGTIILKGVTIGNNSIIAAGSVVLNDVPDNVIYGGNPAVLKKLK